MPLNASPVFKTLSLASLLLAATQAHAGTICSGYCPPDPIDTTETLHYTYGGYLTDLTLMAEQALPIGLSDFYRSLGIAAGQPVAFATSIDVRHTFNSTGTQSVSYSYVVSFGGVSIFGPTTTAYKSGSPFANDYDSAYDDNGVVDTVLLRTASYRFESGDAAVALRSTASDQPNTLSDPFGDRFLLSMTDATAQAFAGALPPDGSALDTLFAGGYFLLKGGLQISDASGILLPFGAPKSDMILKGTFGAAAQPFVPSLGAIPVTPCDDVDAICVSLPVTPQVPVPAAGLLFASGLLGIGLTTRRRAAC